MEMFLKTAAGVLIAVVLCLALERQSKDLSSLRVLAVCAMVTVAALSFLQPVLTFFGELETVGKLDPELMRILLKATGMGLLGEITGTVCADAGYSALGKSVKLLTAGVILCLAVPLFQRLLELIGDILVMI